MGSFRPAIKTERVVSLYKIMNENLESKNIQKHYNDLGGAYVHWAKESEAGLHFGIVEKISDIFSNGRMIQNLTDKVVSSIPHNAERILDAGCGLGHIMWHIEKVTALKRAELVGITLSERQKEEGSEFLFLKKSRAKILLQDFQKTSFANDTFDSILFVESLSYGSGEGKRSSIEEAFRILKPGGTIIIADAFLGKSEQKFGKIFQFLNSKTKKLWSITSWIQEQRFREMIDEKEIVVEKVEDLKWRTFPSMLQVLFYWFPITLLWCIRGKEPLSSLKFLGKIVIYAMPFGAHPAFHYKYFVLRKRVYE